MAAANILRAVITSVYDQGEHSFNDEQDSPSKLLSSSSSAQTSTPDPSLVAKAILTYAILWARRSFVLSPETEPTKGLLPAWIEDIAEDLPLAVRRMHPLHIYMCVYLYL